MDAPPSPEKRSEITMLRVVVVCMVVLYIVLAGYLIYSNQSLGSTQLGYSSLLATQSGQQQEALTQVLQSLNTMQQDDLGRAALINSRLKQLEAQTELITKALAGAEKSRQQIVDTQRGDLAKLREQLTALQSELAAIKGEQQRAAPTWQAELAKMQSALTQALITGGSQREQTLQAVRADLAKLREDIGRTSQTLAGQNQFAQLSQMLDAAITRTRALPQVTAANITEAYQTWQHARLVAGAAAAVPELGERAKGLTGLAEELARKTAVVVTGEVAKYERLATESADPAAAQAAWAKAGDWLRWYPISEDPAVMDRLRELVLAHEAVRQKIQPAK